MWKSVGFDDSVTCSWIDWPKSEEVLRTRLRRWTTATRRSSTTPRGNTVLPTLTSTCNVTRPILLRHLRRPQAAPSSPTTLPTPLVPTRTTLTIARKRRDPSSPASPKDCPSPLPAYQEDPPPLTHITSLRGRRRPLLSLVIFLLGMASRCSRGFIEVWVDVRRWYLARGSWSLCA